MIARRHLAVVAALAGGVLGAGAGCGGSSGSSVTTVTTGVPQVAAAPATAPAPVTVQPPPAVTAAPTATRPVAPPTRTTAAAPAQAPQAAEPTPDRRPKTDRAPIRCLTGAGLVGARQQSPGVWAAKTRSGQPVLVDGPYDKPEDARSSAASLEEVSLAAASRRYVVSAALRSQAGVGVEKVASCLRAADR